jgi:two-component system, probable response regulator PhcQ
MQSIYDFKKFAILYIDDEEVSLKYFTKALESDFRIVTANTPEKGLKLLADMKQELAIIVSDQRMPGMQGVEVLERARNQQPRVLRILATAYTDLEAAISAINNGAIYKYVSKPWEPTDLYATIRRAMEFFLLQREREHLLKEKLSVLHNMMITDRVVSLGVLAAGLGHHIRNSLQAVKTFLELAPAKLEEEQIHIEQLRNPNFWIEFYQHVTAQIKRISDMLADLGVAAEPGASVLPSQVRINEIVSKVVDKMQPRFNQKKITVLTDLPANLPELTVDGWKFHRLIELLLSDEISNLPEGSHIKVSAKAVAGAFGPDSELHLEITDDGPGLPEAALRSIFDPFFVRSDNPQEFGVNLMTCYFIVYHHGGKIEVKNREGGGTVFNLSFPTLPSQTPATLNEAEFLSKVLLNETLWEKLLSGN